jgi:hypothetical protein
MSIKAKFWIAGLVLAAAGIILAKVISPQYVNQPGWQTGLFAAGVLVAIVGLGVIMAGTRKK